MSNTRINFFCTLGSRKIKHAVWTQEISKTIKYVNTKHVFTTVDISKFSNIFFFILVIDRETLRLRPKDGSLDN